MTNISAIETYGASSFTKAKREQPKIVKLRSRGHLAFTVSTDHSRYIVRLALESGKALAECVRARSGTPCKGFERARHCYHTASALLFVTKEAQHA